MTFECERCHKCFKNNWELQRHSNRKNKCTEKKICKTNIEEKIYILGTEINTLGNEVEETKKQLTELNKKYTEENNNIIKCLHCTKSFNFRSNYTKHLKVCKGKNDNISIYERELNLTPEEVENLSCRFCGTSFSLQSCYSRHMNTGCKDKILYESDLRERVLENRRKAAEQKAQIINNNNHYENHNIININLPPMNAVGSENLDYITTKLLIKELKNCKEIKQSDVSSIVDRFTKLIHANPAHPENHNVLFKSLNSGFAKVYTENGFQEQQATEVQDGIIQNVHKLIQTKGCDEYEYKDDVNNKFADVLDDIDVNYGVLGENIKEGTNTRALGKCRNTVKAALYSNKDEIGSTHNLIEL